MEELADEANRGVDLAIRLLDPIKKKHFVVSLADLYQVCLIPRHFHLFKNFESYIFHLTFCMVMQLAGVVAIQAIGGSEIPLHAGRVVSLTTIYIPLLYWYLQLVLSLIKVGVNGNCCINDDDQRIDLLDILAFVSLDFHHWKKTRTDWKIKFMIHWMRLTP